MIRCIQLHRVIIPCGEQSTGLNVNENKIPGSGFDMEMVKSIKYFITVCGSAIIYTQIAR
jgi:hypothetical protein